LRSTLLAENRSTSSGFGGLRLDAPLAEGLRKSIRAPAVALRIGPHALAVKCRRPEARPHDLPADPDARAVITRCSGEYAPSVSVILWSVQRQEEILGTGEAERLANLQSLTDRSLTALDLDDLLGQLLERVQDIFEADTVAVLMLDKRSGDLVARAALGVEAEVRQGVRVPLGSGFAGTVAASRQAVRIDQVDSTTVTNPILWESGVRVMVGAPLLSGDEVLGVVHVGRREHRPFSDHDALLLQVVADRLAGAVQVRQSALERAATDLVERSLLPGRLPSCPGITFAARYAPAEEHSVGGDWYDVFTLPSGQLWIVVGDVAGHGLHAAVVMGRIRSALRAYSLIDAPVAHVLDLVDRKVNHFEIDTMATVACAVSNPPYDTMTLAVAGHPPPVLVSAGQPASFVDVKPGPPIGTNFSIRREATTIRLPAESLMAFYTDGLFERRGEPIDESLESLRSATHHGPANHVAADIMRQMIGNNVLEDDVALVVMKRTADETTAAR
jgi:phosphoserine phosphatase RsbU/P